MLRYKDLPSVGIFWSRTHIANLEKAGSFPKHITLRKRTIAWLRSEVEEFVRARMIESGRVMPIKKLGGQNV